MKNMMRLIQIVWVLRKHGLHEWIQSLHLLGPLRFLLMPVGRKPRVADRGQRIRLALESLGPIFIKLGQTLSTRPDILPKDIADELCKLQDQVPPFASAQVEAILAEAYGQGVQDYFKHFDVTPLASASIAQVHAATLKNGDDVVVKVLRPGVKALISQDIAVMKTLAKAALTHWPASRRFRILDVVNEYEKTIHLELDLMREAANAAQLRRNFPASEQLKIPKVYWDDAREQAIVFERIHGISVYDVDALQQQKVNMKKLAALGVELFFTQVFKHNFFHADMHPGNLFVDATVPDNPSYIAVDFGIVESLSERDQHYIASNFLAFFNRDYRRVASLHIESGWVPKDTSIDEFEQAIRTVSEPIFNKPLKDISFGLFLVELFRVARTFDMHVQPQLTLLQKTLFNIEGLGRQLDPELDLWQTAKPFLEKWMRERHSPLRMLKQVQAQWPQWRELLRMGPEPILQYLRDQAAASESARWMPPAEPRAKPTFWLWGLLALSLALSLALVWGVNQ